MASLRIERMNELLQREISQVLQKDVKDVRIGFVTVTRVDIAPDLKSAKVFVTILGERKERNATFRGLKSAAGFIGGLLGMRMQMRRTPRLVFFEDKGVLHSYHIEDVLDKINKGELIDDGRPLSDDLK